MGHSGPDTWSLFFFCDSLSCAFISLCANPLSVLLHHSFHSLALSIWPSSLFLAFLVFFFFWFLLNLKMHTPLDFGLLYAVSFSLTRENVASGKLCYKAAKMLSGAQLPVTSILLCKHSVLKTVLICINAICLQQKRVDCNIFCYNPITVIILTKLPDNINGKFK